MFSEKPRYFQRKLGDCSEFSAYFFCERPKPRPLREILKELQVCEKNFPKRCETRDISRESESFRSYFEEKRDVQEDSQKFVKDDEEIRY